MSTNLNDQVFKNHTIMKKILNEIDGGLMRNLHIRLISKVFNEACIAKLRKDHARLKIENVPEKEEEEEGSEEDENEQHVEHVFDRLRAVEEALFREAIRQNEQIREAVEEYHKVMDEIKKFREAQANQLANNEADEREKVEDVENEDVEAGFVEDKDKEAENVENEDKEAEDVKDEKNVDDEEGVNPEHVKEESVADEAETEDEDDVRNEEENVEVGPVNNEGIEGVHREVVEHENAEDEDDNAVTVVYINYKEVDVNDVGGYLKFLRDIDVKVEKIYIKKAWMLPVADRRAIHDAIVGTLLAGRRHESVQSLIGMDQICNRCDRCRQLAAQCKVYGPTNGSEFADFNEPKVYNKLSVNYNTLQNSAETGLSLNEEEFYQEMNTRWNPYVRCDTLEIQIPETSSNKDEADHPPLPREVVQYLIQRWEVKNIVLKFCRHTESDSYDSKWSSVEYLSPFRFNEPFEGVQELELKPRIQKVTVDLSNSVHCLLGISGNLRNHQAYKNLVANIQRLFTTHHISIVFSHWSDAEGKLHQILRNLIKTVFLDNHQSNLRVDVCYYATMKQFTYVDRRNALKLGEISFPIEYEERRISCSSGTCRIEENRYWKDSWDGDSEYFIGADDMLNEKWTGRRMILEDCKNRCVVNWDVMIKENEKMKRVTKKLIREHPNALIKRFVDFSPVLSA